MSCAQPVLQARALAIGHAGKVLMEQINMQLSGASLTALMGINGIGKSTLLRTLAGLQRPIHGEVLLHGGDLHALSATDRARHMAIVLTGRPPAGILDVETLVSLGRHPWTDRWGRTTPNDRAAVERALVQTGAAHLRHRLLGTCSDGESQKVLLARALAQDTSVLLLDEPTAFLDLPNRAALVRMLRNEAHQQGKAILFSTHDLQLALDLCDRLVLLRSGEGAWHGTPAEAMASGELARAFSGSGVAFDPASGTHRFLR
ncbi:MAG: ABC transporter ATP-binding protein [Flavobacteriales bacterium]|nr:ABC transporter ATP-binding protein [Flavobacteriales bacterium]